MTSVRLILTDHQWERMQPHLPGKPSDPGRTGADNRLFVEAVLWLARTGVSWRALPDCFGKWNSVFIRFTRWSKAGVWDRLFAAMADDPDFEYIMTGSAIVRAPQHAAGEKGGLKLARSAVREEARRPKSMLLSMPSAIVRGASCRPARPAT